MAIDDLFKINSENSIAKSMQIVAETLSVNPMLNTELMEANMLNSASAVMEAISASNHYYNIFSGNEALIKSFYEITAFQNEILSNTALFNMTKAISAFRDQLAHNNCYTAIEAISQAVKNALIEAPDVALLKLNKPLTDLIDIDLPRGKEL